MNKFPGDTFRWIIGIILSAAVLGAPFFAFSQDLAEDPPAGEISEGLHTIPELLRRPLTGEAPRYPKDRIIGVLGPGAAPDAAWQYARKLLSALVTGNRNSLVPGEQGFYDKYATALLEVEPGRYHIGGGRVEEDGAVSFLVRFLGREQWMTGEFYLRLENENWQVDDLILEEARDLEISTDPYSYDFTPYERFF